MKKFLFVVFVLAAFFMLMRFNSFQSPGPDPVDRLAARIFKEIAKKNDMWFCGVGGGATKEGVWLVSADFQHKGKAFNISEGRQLIIDIAEDFLTAFNANEEIRPYLRDYPFTSKNIDIGIYFYDLNGGDIADPDLDTLAVFSEKVAFYTQDPDNRFRYKTKFYEPYAEALAIVQNESSEGK